MLYFSFILFWLLLAVASADDLRHRRISNHLTSIGAVAGLWCGLIQGIQPQLATVTSLGSSLPHVSSLAATLQGGIVCFAAMFIIWLAGGAGGGDVKLALVIGEFLGWRNGLSALLWGHLAGVTLLTLMWTLQLSNVCSSASRTVPANNIHAGRVTVPMAPLFTLGVVITYLGGGLL